MGGLYSTDAAAAIGCYTDCCYTVGDNGEGWYPTHPHPHSESDSDDEDDDDDHCLWDISRGTG